MDRLLEEEEELNAFRDALVDLLAMEIMPDSPMSEESYVTTDYEPTSQSDDESDVDYVPPNVRRRLF